MKPHTHAVWHSTTCTRLSRRGSFPFTRAPHLPLHAPCRPGLTSRGSRPQTPAVSSQPLGNPVGSRAAFQTSAPMTRGQHGRAHTCRAAQGPMPGLQRERCCTQRAGGARWRYTWLLLCFTCLSFLPPTSPRFPSRTVPLRESQNKCPHLSKQRRGSQPRGCVPLPHWAHLHPP